MAAADLRRGYQTRGHQLTHDELAAGYSTSLTQGLTSSQYQKTLAEVGPNELVPPAATPKWMLWLQSVFTGFFNLLLWAGSILCFIAYGLDGSDATNLYLGVVLAGVVLLSGTFGFFQDASSAAIMDGFKSFLPSFVSVVRDGQSLRPLARTLVPGDLIQVSMGDRVPADCAIIRCSSDAQVDHSALTGESDPQNRSPSKSSDDPLETKNLVFFGTTVLRGSIEAIVINTASRTMMGRIAALADATSNTETPIKREINHFIKVISAIAITLGVLFFIIAMIIDYDWVKNLVFMIGIIVANVPEGLIVTVTLSLAVTAQRMGRKNVLVKNLEAVETLGSTSCICSDKTGTLTTNVMTVAHVYYDVEAKACDTSIAGAGDFNRNDTTFKSLTRIASLCNNTRWEDSAADAKSEVKVNVETKTTTNNNSSNSSSTRRLKGDASECAITRFIEPVVGPLDSIRETHKQAFQIPFNSSNKWQLSVRTLPSSAEEKQSVLMTMKGAPDVVLLLCSRILIQGQVKPLTDSDRDILALAIRNLAAQGERVLAFCHNPLVEPQWLTHQWAGSTINDCNFPMNDFIFVGLISMIDPPRPGVPEAVHTCKTAGIKVIMVTGDHPLTARAIARKVGIISNDTIDEIAAKLGQTVAETDDSLAKAVVVEGKELNHLMEQSTEVINSFWDRVLNKPDVVFARTSPQQKLLIVEACQARGAVVAVTGDGVNDAPALKKADIGVAMGIGGTEVAKDAADMILLDDNFASIVNGIEEGRLIFDNLKKSIAYTLSSNIPELFPFLAFIIVQIPLPLSTVLILCIDLGTDLVPAISFAHEVKEADIMMRPPRQPGVDRLVTPRLISFAYLQIGMVQVISAFYAYFVVLMDYGYPVRILPGLGTDWGKSELYCYENDYPKCHFSEQATSSPIWLQRSADHQKEALETAQTAYFVAIVIVQWADLIISKTRLLSITDQGMSNRMMNFGLLFETCLAIFISYTPGVNTVFGARPLRLVHWFCALPWCVLLFIYDEIRRWFVRHGKRSITNKLAVSNAVTMTQMATPAHDDVPSPTCVAAHMTPIKEKDGVFVRFSEWLARYTAW